MLAWVLFAILTAVVLAALLRPLFRTDSAFQSRKDLDIAVYKDQLAAIEEEAQRGLTSADDVEAAKIEVSRRLLASAENGETIDASEDVKDRGPVVLASIVGTSLLIPLLSIALYLAVGSPGVSDQPLSARTQSPLDQQRISSLIARVEARLREQPEDGDGWAVIAPVYLRLGQYGKAEHAFREALRIRGEDKLLLFGLGETIRLGNGGVITERSKHAFEKAVKLDPNLLSARFRLAVAMEQDGLLNDAVKEWQDILSRAGPDLPWRKDVEQRLENAKKKLVAANKGGDVQSAATPKADPGQPPEPKSVEPGPSKEDIAAAAKLSASERVAMINSMVDRLSDRLKENGKDVDGWLRLVRSLTVLGRKDDALKALKDAREALAGNDAGLAKLEQLSKQLRLGS